MMKRVWLDVCFALKVPKKPKSEIGKKLVSGLILDFELVFALLELKDWFSHGYYGAF